MVEEVDGDDSGHEKMWFCLVGYHEFVLMSAGFGRIVTAGWHPSQIAVLRGGFVGLYKNPPTCIPRRRVKQGAVNPLVWVRICMLLAPARVLLMQHCASR